MDVVTLPKRTEEESDVVELRRRLRDAHAAIAEKDATIADTNAIIDEKDARIAAHETTIARLRTQLEGAQLCSQLCGMAAATWRAWPCVSSSAGSAAQPQQLEQPTECDFFFVSAAYLRSVNVPTLPCFQELRRTDGALILRTLVANKAYRGEYTKKLLAISHRWEHPSVPDGQGVQLRAIKDFLATDDDVEGVWYDFWSMPQDERTPEQRRSHAPDTRTPEELNMFKRMLPNVNLLYLGCSVLILMDISYLSRFWVRPQHALALPPALVPQRTE